MKSSVAAMPLPNLGEWPQTVKGARVVGLGAPLLGYGAQMVRELPAQLAKVSGNDLPALCIICRLEVYGSVLAVQASRRTTIIARLEGRGESGHPTGGRG